MQVAWFVEPLNIKVILGNLGLMLRLFGLFCLAPLLVSLLNHEFEYSMVFGALAVATVLAGLLSRTKTQPDLTTKEALVVTALVYLLFALLGALAFLPAAPFLNAFFEAMSGFTTTGLSVLDVEQLPKSLLFFRASAQWIGGAGIVILSLVALVGPGKSAFQLYTSEFGEKNLVGDVKATARLVVKVYLALTCLGYISFVIAGMGFFDALLHVMSTLSTGGFSPFGRSIGQYQSPAVTIVVVVFMLFGAIGFPSYYVLWHKGWKRSLGDIQLRYLLGFVLVCIPLFYAMTGSRVGSLLPGLFYATSTITTTGYEIVPTASLPDGIKLLGTFLMIIGGSAGSTSGGIKLFRLILMIQLVKWLVMRSLLPDEAKLPIKCGGRVMTDREIKQAFGFFALYLFFACFTSLFLVIDGFSITDSFFESASALGTVGLSTGITSPDLSAWAKLLLIFNMWAGRLEILPVLVVMYPRVWTRIRRTG